jgi:hypothetical protein
MAARRSHGPAMAVMRQRQRAPDDHRGHRTEHTGYAVTPAGAALPPARLLTGHMPVPRWHHRRRIKNRRRPPRLRGSLGGWRVQRGTVAPVDRRGNPRKRLRESLGFHDLRRDGHDVPVRLRWPGRAARDVRRPARPGYVLLGGRRGCWVAGLVRGTGFPQGGSPFWRGLFLTGRRSLPGRAGPGRCHGPGLGCCLFLARGGLFVVLRDGRRLLGHLLLPLSNRCQQAQSYGFRQYWLLNPGRRPWRISRTAHPTRQRSDAVVFCRVDHPPGHT